MKIAIVRLSAMGDIIQSMVVLQFIKKHIPDSTIDWFVEKKFSSILQNNPDISNIFEINFEQVKKRKSFYLLFKELNKLRRVGNYDVVIDFQGLIKSAVVAKLIPSVKTVGFDRESTRERFASLLYDTKYKCNYDMNVIKRNVFIAAKALGFKVKHQEIITKLPYLFYEKSNNLKPFSNSGKILLIVPGASFKSKIYPPELFADVINKLSLETIIIWGNKEEYEIAKMIKCFSQKASLAPELNINELKRLISQVDIVIGGDTGPTHIAWALNVPSITLYGCTPGKRNSFCSLKNKVIESNTDVNPRKINRNDFSISSIKPNRIVKIAKKILG